MCDIIEKIIYNLIYYMNRYDFEKYFMYFILFFAITHIVTQKITPLIFIIICISMFVMLSLLFTTNSKELLTDKKAKKIFYNFDEKNAQYKNVIYFIGNENIDSIEKFINKYNDYIYRKEIHDSNFISSIFNNFGNNMQNKIQKLEKNIENDKKINESVNKFKHDKEIKNFIIKNFMWEIFDSEIIYEITESIKLDTNYTLDKKNMDKYIYIDDGYYFDNINIKNHDYHLDFIVKNNNTCDLITISSNKNKNIQDVKQNIKDLENTISELKKEISEIKNTNTNQMENKITTQDKTIENQPENEQLNQHD
jgi:hypothetical protein